MCWSGSSGFERRPIRADGNPFTRGADRERFSEFYAELDAKDERCDDHRIGLRRAHQPIPDRPRLQRDIDNFKAALATASKVEEGFLPVAAPASVIPDRKDEYYKKRRESLSCTPSPRRCGPNTR